MHNRGHPREVLLEFLPKDLPVTEAASILGVSRQALSALKEAQSTPDRSLSSHLMDADWAHQRRVIRARTRLTNSARSMIWVVPEAI